MNSQTASLANQMKHRDREMVPRFLVIAMFSLMLISLILVAYAQWANVPKSGVLKISPIEKEITVSLVGDRSVGVAVQDMAGNQLAHSNLNKSGFIDVIWVSVMRERTVQNKDMTAPIRVVRRENGHTAILDDATGWSIELIGYGQDNVAAFAKLID
jgi:putative photosynthetic complex assembly protein